MSFQLKQSLMILFSLAILGCIYSQRITIPLKINQQEQLSFFVKYGTNQCEIDVIPNIKDQDCYNVITQEDQDAEYCGTQFYSDNTFTKGKDYLAPFQLGDTEATLIYTVPTDKQSPIQGTNVLCFGFSFQDQRNALQELFNDNLIAQEIVFFSLNSSVNPEGSIGEIDIGSPDTSLLKRDAKIVQLKSALSGDTSYSARNDVITFFDQTLDSKKILFFSLDSPFHLLTSDAFENILQIFDNQGIQYTYHEDQDQKVFLPSIENLQPIKLYLAQTDFTEFLLIIRPSQYTRQLSNGQYQLLIKPLFQASFNTLGYTIFESYYVGFDQNLRAIFIGEKPYYQVQNFRGPSNITE